ncbi:MAG: hypothetical protein J7F05_24145 [Trichodesmium erythraeum GBRTRLIN201]|nr:hypothetical protein [Trichodesmium erythraeum GBRTRLIN201]
MTSDSSERKQYRNPVVLEFGGADSDDISDLRRGEGKLFKRIEQIIAQLQEQGDVGENIQPIIVVTKKKKKKRGLFD